MTVPFGVSAQKNGATPQTHKSVKGKTTRTKGQREFNGIYSGEFLSRVAFPIGGIGAGMFCMEGTGTISYMSIHHKPDPFNEPCTFAAIHVKGIKNGTKVPFRIGKIEYGRETCKSRKKVLTDFRILSKKYHLMNF